jgi:iron-sulfur cluster repair protein YtfE (RIC family)
MMAATASLIAKGARAAPTGIFERFHDSLVQVHGELSQAAGGIAETIVDARKDADTQAAILAFTDELLNHHKSEDSFFFPAFRSAGRMRSSDVAWLDKKDEEHVAIHRTCVELRDATAKRARSALAVRTWRSAVITQIATLASLSKPHFAEEEATLTADHVKTLLSADELASVYRDMGLHWQRR